MPTSITAIEARRSLGELYLRAFGPLTVEEALRILREDDDAGSGIDSYQERFKLLHTTTAQMRKAMKSLVRERRAVSVIEGCGVTRFWLRTRAASAAASPELSP